MKTEIRKCPACYGLGALPGNFGTCNECKGTGEITTEPPDGSLHPGCSVRVMHECVVCKNRWESPDSETERHVLTAIKVNKDGPYCGMCHHLEMAERYAQARGFERLEGGVKIWRIMRSARLAPNDPGERPGAKTERKQHGK